MQTTISKKILIISSANGEKNITKAYNTVITEVLGIRIINICGMRKWEN